MKSAATADPPLSVRCRRPAMASWFEVRLIGPDDEHLRSVGEAMLDEIERVECLLSRFDPASSLSRVNREAPEHPVRIEIELFQVLKHCLDWHRLTEGFFNPCRPRDNAVGPPLGRFDEILEIPEDAPYVLRLDPRFEIDLGGFGKGYALDRSARLLDTFGVRSALIEGGTSSVLARGLSESAQPWLVAVRDPLDPGQTRQIARCQLQGGLSSSAAFAPGSPNSDVLDPTTGRPLSSASACSVLAPSATEAEILSTALLAMGRERAENDLKSQRFGNNIHVLWTDCHRGRSCAQWLGREKAP